MDVISLLAVINENHIENPKSKIKSHQPEAFDFLIEEINNLSKRGNYPIKRNGKFYTWRLYVAVTPYDYVEQSIMISAKGHNSKIPCVLGNYRPRPAKSKVKTLEFFFD